MDADKAKSLVESVRDAYSAAAERPGDRHAFPVGRAFAESLGYPGELLQSLPASCVDAFAGVSNVSLFAEIPEGSSVLDLGCGAGLDALIAARRTGPKGKVIGVDFSDAMLKRARSAAAEAGVSNAQFLAGDADRLSIPDASVDVALVNGIFNLNPKRDGIFTELARVMRPGGLVFAAELIMKESQPGQVCQTNQNWFA
jgi:SAM-dependent methyltransferase